MPIKKYNEMKVTPTGLQTITVLRIIFSNYLMRLSRI